MFLMLLLLLSLVGLTAFILAVHIHSIAMMGSSSSSAESGDYFLKMSALPSYPGFKYGLFHREGTSVAVTYREFLGLLLRSDPAVLQLLTEALVSHYDAVFFECVPVSASSLDTQGFEFVVLRAARLEGVAVDINPFEHNFRSHRGGVESDNQVIAFPNLGRDSLLVVPCPPQHVTASRQEGDSQLNHFAHLAAFLRGASAEHRSNLWRVVAEQLLASLTPQDPLSVAHGQQLWLSTSGLGVSWLHVRIDRVPKYYNYREYKQTATT